MEIPYEVKNITTLEELDDLEDLIFNHAYILDTQLRRVYIETDYDLNARLYISDGASNQIIVKMPIDSIKKNEYLKDHLIRYYANSEDWLT